MFFVAKEKLQHPHTTGGRPQPIIAMTLPCFFREGVSDEYRRRLKIPGSFRGWVINPARQNKSPFQEKSENALYLLFLIIVIFFDRTLMRKNINNYLIKTIRLDCEKFSETSR